jgi:protein SCO1/2
MIRQRKQNLRNAKLLLMLQLLLTAGVVPAFVSSHDQSAPSRVKGPERREVRIPIKDFTLVDQGGRPFRFQSLRGRVAIVTFAYTTCPDVCPLLTAAMRQTQESLNRDERLSTYFVTVTTDPEIDTPQLLAAYARRYRADLTNWAFLAGDETALKKVWKNFGVGVSRKARGLIDHTTLIAVVDRGGTMRSAYIGPSPDPAAIRQDLRELLRSK